MNPRRLTSGPPEDQRPGMAPFTVRRDGGIPRPMQGHPEGCEAWPRGGVRRAPGPHSGGSVRPATTDRRSLGLAGASGGRGNRGWDDKGGEPGPPRREGYCRRSPSTSPGSGPGSPAATAASSCSSTNLFSSNSSISTRRKREDSVFRAIVGARRPPRRLGFTPYRLPCAPAPLGGGKRPPGTSSARSRRRPPTSGMRRNRKFLGAAQHRGPVERCFEGVRLRSRYCFFAKTSLRAQIAPPSAPKKKKL